MSRMQPKPSAILDRSCSGVTQAPRGSLRARADHQLPASLRTQADHQLPGATGAEVKLTEQQIARAIVQHYRARGANNVFMFAVPNGGFRRPIEAAIMKATGTVAGVADTIWIKDGHVFALELKADGGRLTAIQRDTMEQMALAGATVAVSYGLTEALTLLERWGLLRGTSS
jgi:hypothetical protein